jgi:hypothetical protein
MQKQKGRQGCSSCSLGFPELCHLRGALARGPATKAALRSATAATTTASQALSCLGLLAPHLLLLCRTAGLAHGAEFQELSCWRSGRNTCHSAALGELRLEIGCTRAAAGCRGAAQAYRNSSLVTRASFLDKGGSCTEA